MSAEAKKNLQPYIKLDIDKAIKEKKTIYISTAITAMDEHHKAELEKVSEESIEYNADEWANKINEYGPISESFIAGAKWLLQKLKQ